MSLHTSQKTECVKENVKSDHCS